MGPKRQKLITDYLIRKVEKPKYKTGTTKIPDSPITWDQIRNTLKKCQNYIAASADGIPVELYKTSLEDHKCKPPIY